MPANLERRIVILNKPTKHNTSHHLQMARTTRETVHGNPGERRILPANTLVVLIPASNLPPDSAIKSWAHPVEGHPWPAATEAWARMCVSACTRMTLRSLRCQPSRMS